ncbi:MAG: carbohydrate kinase [Paracoccaceae bacterium]
MIICCGEALIDMVPVEGNETPTFAAHCGGAVYNTAVALGRLGAPVALVSGVSEDALGERLVHELQDSGVDINLLIRSARPTTLAMVHLQNGSATYSFYDEGSAGRMIGPGDLPDLPDTVNACFFGGISLCMTPVADTLVGFAERLASDRVIMVDPNIRPGFADDERTYRDRITRLLACADLVKLSDEDLDWLYPGLNDGARREQLLANGVTAAFITRGGHGAEAWLASGETVHTPSEPVNVVDTIGAGDTFNAGILAYLSANGHLNKQTLQNLTATDWQAAMTLAAKAAAITVSRAGANPPWRADLNT